MDNRSRAPPAATRGLRRCAPTHVFDPHDLAGLGHDLNRHRPRLRPDLAHEPRDHPPKASTMSSLVTPSAPSRSESAGQRPAIVPSMKWHESGLGIGRQDRLAARTRRDAARRLSVTRSPGRAGLILLADRAGRADRLAGAGIRSRARCAPPGRDRSVGHGNDVTEGDSSDERTGYEPDGPGRRLRGPDRGPGQAVRRPYRGGPGGPAGPGGDGVWLSGARRRREDRADPDAAGADGCDVQVGAGALAPGPGRALGCAAARGGDGRGAACS